MKKFEKWNNLDKHLDTIFSLNEAVKSGQQMRAVQLASNIISRRIGSKIHISPITQIAQKVGGIKVEGIVGVFGMSKIRFNWKIGSSAEIISVDIWNNLTEQPDITVDLNEIPLVKCVAIIADSINSKVPIGSVVLEERVQPKTQGAVSKNIANAIRQWAIDVDISDSKLEKTRISHLYNDFEYWRNEVAEQGVYKSVSPASFRNYLVDYIQKAGLTNIFMRVVVSGKAKKEKIIVDAKEESSFSNAIYSMSLDDQFDLAEMAIISLLKGYKAAQGIFSTTGGVGKTTLVQNVLKNEGKGKYKKVEWKKGNIQKPIDFYKILYDNRKDTIIVFDDVEVLFKKPFEDLMKASTETGSKRLVSFYDDPKKLGKYPTEFTLSSSLIFLANIKKDKLSSALQRRLTPIQIEGTKQDIIDRIRTNLEKVLPEVDMTIKLEVLNFIEAHVKYISQIEFSSFKDACTYRLSKDNPVWKKQILFILRKV